MSLFYFIIVKKDIVTEEDCKKIEVAVKEDDQLSFLHVMERYLGIRDVHKIHFNQHDGIRVVRVFVRIMEVKN